MTSSTSTMPPFKPVPNPRAPATEEPPDAHPSTQGQDRTEPYWGGPSIPPFASAAYEQLHRDSASQSGTAAARRARPFSRVLLMVAIFGIGTLVGLAAAWWTNPESLGHRLAAVIGTAATAPSPNLKNPGQDNQHPEPTRGIGAGELPYDGAPPPTATQTPEAAPANTAGNAPGAVVQGSNDATVDHEQSSNGDGAAQMTASASREERRDALAPTVAATPAPAKPAEKMNAQQKTSESKVAKLVHKRRPAPKVAKNREIDRIRQQAEEELKKKTESGSRSPGGAHAAGARTRRQASAAIASANSHATGNVLARCDRIGNIFRREQCKWRLCNGRWGKNGCPSYATARNSY